jgi:asparagine synthase (glutamine-hydrolysing)
VDFSLSLPAEWKLRHEGWAEKELLRKASRDLVPEKILRRPKKKFSDGAGSVSLLAEYANRRISDGEFLRHQDLITESGLRSKEELLYFQIFQSIFGTKLSPTLVGRTRSITNEELQ